MPLANSSRIREKISTLASTAIPTVKTIPAIPGKVRVNEKLDITATNSARLDISAMFAAMPNTL